MKRNLRIGLFGGSFDPVHNGHIALAKAAKTGFDLDKVIFIPAKNPPHKQTKQPAPAGIRMKILSAAVKPYKFFSISRYELERPATTYTYQTAEHFKMLFPRAKLFFIIGADSLVELKSWKNIKRLAGMLTFIASGRHGVSIPQALPFKNSVEFLTSKIPAVSSSQVRASAALGKSIKKLVPTPVEKIILANGIYCGRVNG